MKMLSGLEINYEHLEQASNTLINYTIGEWKMKCIMNCCAESVIIDQRSNSVSIINVIEGIQVPAFPVFIPKIHVISLLERENEEPIKCDFQVLVKNNNQILIDMKTEINFLNKMKSRHLVEVAGIAIPAPGEVTFFLNYKGKEICSYSIQVLQIGENINQITH
jgi:hypothetical protein